MHSGGADNERNALRSTKYGDLVPLDLASTKLDRRKPREDASERELDLDSGKRRPDAEMRTAPELEMSVRRACDVKRVWLWELARIASGRADR